jgi:hypothetical protein
MFTCCIGEELQLHLAGYPDTRDLVDFFGFHLAQWLK